MSNSKKIIALLILLISCTINAQIAPTSGKKVLEVKENHEGEYLQTVSQGDISDNVMEVMKKRVPEKLSKYGFNDITLISIGQVPVPEGWASKMGNMVSNKSVGKSMLLEAKTYNEMVRAVDKMYQPEDTDKVDWKFQVNFKDNITGKEFKVRLNLMYTPQYIIKESDLVKDLSN